MVAGRDREAGGSWLGLSDEGVVASVLNRRHTLGAEKGKRSRGELVLAALEHASAAGAAAAVSALDGDDYRAFNMLIADHLGGFWLKSTGHGEPIEAARLEPGVTMLTAWDANDANSSDRVRHYLPRFCEAPLPDPALGDWSSWEALLASTDHATGAGDTRGAMHLDERDGFGTVSSSLIALPNPAVLPGASAVWRFASAWPTRQPYRPILP